MKRTATALALALAAAALLTGASVWEGAAATAAAGELPESGYYVATNAFPRNTVVDVKNLENDKTIRAIVSGGLDSPGLLASLSREAAAAIGMSSRDIGRVRMTMPADPIAFARFNEGFEPSGDPDHDPKAAIAAATAPALAPAESPVPELLPEEAVELAETEPQIEAAPPIEAEAPIAAPEEEIPVDLAEIAEDGEAADPLEVDPEIAEAAPEPAMAIAPVEEAGAAEIAVAPEPAAEEPAVEEAAPAEIAVMDEAATEIPIEEAPVDEPAELAAVPEAEPVLPPPASEVVDVTLVPAEERPPELSEGMDLPAEAEVAPLAEPVIPEPAPAAVAVIQDESPQPPASRVPNFSAPVIADLEKGKYYLQIGAFGKAEAVEAEIAKHGKSYPLAIQSAGSAEKPVYRVLLGPVNLGESGALLQRFKRSGYRDAFVKQGSL